jgi:hypothetical protein
VCSDVNWKDWLMKSIAVALWGHGSEPSGSVNVGYFVILCKPHNLIPFSANVKSHLEVFRLISLNFYFQYLRVSVKKRFINNWINYFWHFSTFTYFTGNLLTVSAHKAIWKCIHTVLSVQLSWNLKIYLSSNMRIIVLYNFPSKYFSLREIYLSKFTQYRV